MKTIKEAMEFSQEMLHSAMATIEGVLTPDALEDFLGLTSYADELRDTLENMEELDAGIVGFGRDDCDALEWLHLSLIHTRDVCWMWRRYSKHPALWRVGYAADVAARKLALLVGEDWFNPAFVYTTGGAEADRAMAAYYQRTGRTPPP